MERQKQINVVAWIVAAILIVGYAVWGAGLVLGAPATQPATQPATKAVTGEGVSVSVPNHWVKGPNAFGTLLIVGAPSEDVGFTPNVNVLRCEGDGLDPVTVVRATRQQLKKVGDGLVWVSDQVVQFGGGYAVRMEYSMRMAGNQVRFIQYTWSGGKNVAYVATATCRDESAEKYRPTFEAAMASIRVGK